MSQLTETALAKLQTLASMRSGDHVNDYLLSVANHIRHEASSASEAKTIILPYLQQARPERSSFEIERELNRQIATAYTGYVKSADLTQNFERKPAWPEPNQRAIERIANNGPGQCDLWERSPIRWCDDQPHTEEIIDVLFPNNPLLCVGRSNSNFTTDRREALRGRCSQKQLIVPSPMSACTGKTKEGKVSEHTLDNTSPRKFLVTEFDHGTADAQAAVIWHLSQYGKLVMVVHSGSKSLHGWFYCAGSDESDSSSMKKFFRYAMTLGACRSGWTKSQFMRMPDGMRDSGNRQSVIYFNSEVVK
jgi:hypothetical protein